MSQFLTVKVLPGSLTREVVGTMSDGTLKVRVRSKRDQWKANQELIEYIGELYWGEWQIYAWQTSTRKFLRSIDEKSSWW